MKPMIYREDHHARVCHLTSVHVPFDTRIFSKECQSLAEMGFDVHLVAGNTEDIIRDGVHIHGVRRRGNRVGRMVFTAAAVYRKAFSLDADIYHIHDPELIPAAILLTFRGKRVVYDMHEDYSSWLSFNEAIPRFFRATAARMFSILERYAVRRFAAVVTVTPPIMEKFRTVNPRTVLVRNFPRASEFAPDGKPPAEWALREDAVCYVGRITPERGIREMLCATASANRTRPVKILLGGDLSPGARDIVDSFPKTDSEIHEIFGYVDRQRISEIFRRARAGLLLLHPERNFLVSYPTKLFEYMSAGLPVVASDFPMFRELDRGIGCCMFVDPLDPEAAASAIIHLLEHPAEAEEMGLRGFRAIREKYSWESEALTLKTLYDDILRTPARPT